LAGKARVVSAKSAALASQETLIFAVKLVSMK
jgi:hypothetical protein